MSFDRLIERIGKTQNPTVVGLDPKLEYIPKHILDKAFGKYGETLKAAGKALYSFNKGIIDAVCDVVPAVKPQAAYYEMYGIPGLKALHKTQEYARKKGMYVITDCKRNDIGSTMEAYSTAHLGEVKVGSNKISPFIADAMTVNAYFGSDGVKPAINVCKEYNKGIFILVKTSNPSSGELQDKITDGKTVYEVMGEMCKIWGEGLPGKYGYNGVGAVIGATYPEELELMRDKLPGTMFLIPGYGAQGGTAKDIVKAFDKNGKGALVNSSRAVMCAYQKEGCDGKDYAAAALREVIRMKHEIMDLVGEIKI